MNVDNAANVLFFYSSSSYDERDSYDHLLFLMCVVAFAFPKGTGRVDIVFVIHRQ